MHNPEGRYHRASWLPVIAADILPIVRLDIRNERIHILDILHVDDSPDLLKLFGSHQHVTCTRYGINDIHGRPAMFFDGLPEIVGKFGRHGISQGGRWMIPVYLNRLMKARNIGREPSIGSRPEDDGPLGQLVDSLSPSKSEKRRRFPPENRSDTDFLSTRRTLSWALADKPSSSMAALSVDVHTPKANVQYTTLDRKPLKSVRNRHQTNTILNTSHEPKSTTVLELKYRSYEMFTIIQEFTEKYRGFRGSLFSIHPLSGCERLPRERAGALIRISAHLHDRGKGTVLKGAMEAVREIRGVRDRAQALVALVPRLAELGQVEQALEVARGIGDEWDRTLMPAALVSRLADLGRVEQALEVARGIGDAKERAR